MPLIAHTLACWKCGAGLNRLSDFSTGKLVLSYRHEQTDGFSSPCSETGKTFMVLGSTVVEVSR